MKRSIYMVLLLAICIVMSGCSELYTALQSRITPETTIFVVGSQNIPEFRDLTPEMFDDAKSDYIYRYSFEADPKEQYQLIRNAAADPSTAVLVAELRSTVYASAMIECARSAGLPLILCGARPAEAIMERYDNCWYVGFDPLLAAELQAKFVTDAFRGGRLTDQNGDYKFTGLLAGSTDAFRAHAVSYGNTLLNNIRLAGVNLVEAVPAVRSMEEASLSATLEQLLLPQPHAAGEEAVSPGNSSASLPFLAPAAETELFLCADTKAAHAVLETVKTLDAAAADETLAPYATPQRQYRICTFGIDDAIEKAIREGLLLGAVGKDAEACTDAVMQICENLARKEAITRNNDFHFEYGKYLMLEYRVLAADAEVE